MQNIIPKRNDSCEKIIKYCFKNDFKEIVNKTDFLIYTPKFTTQEERKSTIQKYLENVSLHACTYTDITGKEINFFFTRVQTSSKQYILLFKREDNTLGDAEDVEPYALIDDDDFAKVIFIGMMFF